MHAVLVVASTVVVCNRLWPEVGLRIRVYGTMQSFDSKQVGRALDTINPLAEAAGLQGEFTATGAMLGRL